MNSSKNVHGQSTSDSHFHLLNYNPKDLPRELKPFYIGTDEADITSMLRDLGHKDLKDVFSHLDPNVLFPTPPAVTETLSYNDLIEHMVTLANKNTIRKNFYGGSLKHYSTTDIVPFVCSLRALTTAYTPYQPERSQGTLTTLWIYSSMLSKLTGFEAINASFYDRSTTLFEAIQTGLRLHSGKTTAIVCESIPNQDKDVLNTLKVETGIEILYAPIDAKTGITDLSELTNLIEKNKENVGVLAFPQMNDWGLLEDVHALTDTARKFGLKTIAIIDPMLLGTKGLIPPTDYGSHPEPKKRGVDMIVGEGQHLAIGPNFGGPGLGIFGIRFNDECKNDIRQTAGRFIGKTKDAKGRDALCMVLSTREQHIRREKATSNICSNQSFVASIAGASMLLRGEKGFTESLTKGRTLALEFVQGLKKIPGVQLVFPHTPFFNEVLLSIPMEKNQLKSLTKNFALNAEQKKSLPNHIADTGFDLGIYYSDKRTFRPQSNTSEVLISFFDHHSSDDVAMLLNFFQTHFSNTNSNTNSQNLESIADIPQSYLRKGAVGFPSFSLQELKIFYTNLANQNVSPDDSLYPLGSCTMKYNPYINDWAASLPGFTDLHPEADWEDAQGALEILHHIQTMFQSITGLPGVTTEPVAGAQGELVGLKMFQAYHRDHSPHKRDIILIPKSAHGTNPATATYAGFDSKVVDGDVFGIVTINANAEGQIDFSNLQDAVKNYGPRISGIMVTNPNTSGIFENDFKKMADLIHSVGGLVYMDGANMNAIAGIVDLNRLGVDAVHNNLHKTWTIPHGGGGPGDGIVAVSEKLLPYLNGYQVKKEAGRYIPWKPAKSIGHVHRHFGNFAHKIRAYSYIKILGSTGVQKMSAVAVLSSQYLFHHLKTLAPSLPERCENVPRMHEFILTLTEEMFQRLEKKGTAKNQAIPRIGKLFLDFGLHAPTVAFPEQFGLMIEPTESFSKAELDRFIDTVKAIYSLVMENPEVLTTAPHFTPVYKVDEVLANKLLQLKEELTALPYTFENVIHPKELGQKPIPHIMEEILKAHEKFQS